MTQSLFVRGRVFALILSLLAVPKACLALDNLPDPTRPPSVLGPLGSAFGEETEKAAPALPVLQSIMLSATRKAAVISGQTVELGGKFGDLRLVKVLPSEVVLKGEDGVQVLKFFPEVEKKERILPPDEIVKVKKRKSGATTGKKVKS
ncbi:MAG: hypothetical protein KGZ83_04325 [Sulfuricella sp.]|nr:hypothetical protein [Sulfuricella sp.]